MWRNLNWNWSRGVHVISYRASSAWICDRELSEKHSFKRLEAKFLIWLNINKFGTDVNSTIECKLICFMIFFVTGLFGIWITIILSILVHELFLVSFHPSDFIPKLIHWVRVIILCRNLSIQACHL